ncbi:MAG TPA: serine hydrolase domain-containing protein, partial [Blastocatellia bacterium]|nr:serine hydrolase domain-containing protein [Blastocatellia bacterium]
GSKLAPKQIDAEVERLITKGRVPGLALALIQNGKPVYVKSYGLRSVEKNQPLETDTVMYGASLTKLIFAYFVMQLVDEGKINLDQPISAYLKKPLPDYPKYADLAGNPRWRSLTARMLLDHTPGFPNFRFLNPDGKLDFKFDPGTRYAYSGEGINLLQFVLEEGLGLDVGKEMQRRIFDRFGMIRTSMTWRDDFAQNLADGYDVNGKLERHHARGSVRAAGSMDTTITDYAKFLAAFMRGEGLSAAARNEMLRPQIAIKSAHQFPTLDATTERANLKIGLSAGLGSVLFKSPYGAAFFKGGHDDWTGNMVVCVESKKQCILLLSNSVRGEVIYPALIKSVFGDTRLPWSWEYNPQGSPPPIY